jgi:hypothetical protein
VYFCILNGKQNEASILQPVQLLNTDFTAKGSEYDSRYKQDFSSFQIIQTGSGTPTQASSPKGTGISSPGVKAVGSWT